VSDKIEPIDTMHAQACANPGGTFDVASSSGKYACGVRHDGQTWSVLKDIPREGLAALVRWGAAALARTHPDRQCRAEHTSGLLCGLKHGHDGDHKPAIHMPCAHNITNANADAVVCAGCGETLRNDAVPTDAEGAE
jgi:hypothetical protein